MLRRSAARKDQPRNIRLRSRIVFMMVSLAFLAVYTFVVTALDGYNLLQTNSRNSNAGQPTKSLLNVLQVERRQSLEYVGARHRGAVPSRAELNQARARTDQTIVEWRNKTEQAPGGKIKEPIADTSRKLAAVVKARTVVDQGAVSREAAEAPYNTAIDAAFAIMRVNAQLDDPDIAADGQALISLTRTRELLAREDAELAGALAEGRLPQSSILQFAQAAGIRATSEADTRAMLPTADRARLDGLRRGAAYTALQQMEDRVTQRTRTRGRPPVTSTQWENTTRPLLAQYDQLIDLGGKDLLDRAAPLAYLVIGKLLFAGVLGLVALATSIWLAITASRNMLRQLQRLRTAAEDLAEHRLPAVIERLTRGEQVNVEVEAPPLQFGTDEIGQVGHAFNRVQREALRSAVAVAEGREATRRMLLASARRSLALINRQIVAITDMEKRQDMDPAHVSDLFALDALTNRGRRQVTNQILLAGERTTRAHRRQEPLYDVVRGALGEVEGFERVKIQRFGVHHLKAYAVDDCKSIFAELLDNAVSFSPGDVDVESEMVALGVAVSIHDRGLGMSHEQLDRVNEFFRDPPEFLTVEHETVADIKLGHFVVAVRARENKIQITLRRSPYGGVTATVLIPHDLFLPDGLPDPTTTQPARPPVQKVLPATATPPAAPDRAAGDAAGAEPGRQASVTLLHPAPVHHEQAAPAADEAEDSADQQAAPAPTSAEADQAESPETPGGLPIRRPQENLAPALRTDEPLTSEPEDDPGPRDPEEVKRIMSAYQKGTRQGRQDGEHGARTTEAPEDDGAPVTDNDA